MIEVGFTGAGEEAAATPVAPNVATASGSGSSPATSSAFDLWSDAADPSDGEDDPSVTTARLLVPPPALGAVCNAFPWISSDVDAELLPSRITAGAQSAGLGVVSQVRAHAEPVHDAFSWGRAAAEQEPKPGPAPDDGSPLPDSVRSKLERASGSSLSSVRVHTGAAAAAATAAHDARAIAIDQDIHLAEGELDGAAGERLLAHEVAHTIQQKQSGRAPRVAAQPRTTTAPTSEAEVEADRFADAVAEGRTPPLLVASLDGEIARTSRGALEVDTSGADLRMMRVTAYYGHGKRKTWVGSTKADASATYQWRWADGGWDTGGGPDDIEIWTVKKTKSGEQEAVDPRPVARWAKGASLVVIEIGDSTAEMLDSGRDEQLEGAAQATDAEPDTDTSEGGSNKDATPNGTVDGDATGEAEGEKRARQGAGERWEDHQEGRPDANRAESDKNEGTGTSNNDAPAGPPNAGKNRTTEPTAGDSTGSGLNDKTGHPDESGVDKNGNMDHNRRQGDEDGDWSRNAHPESGNPQATRRPEGTADGLAMGEEGGRAGGVPNAFDWWGVLSVPKELAATLALAGMLTEADFGKVAERLMKKAQKVVAKKAAKGAAKKGLRTATKALRKDIQQEVDKLVEQGMNDAARELERIPDWQYMDKTARASKLKQAEEGLRDHIERRLEKHLDDRADEAGSTAAELEGDIASGTIDGDNADTFGRVAKDLRHEKAQAEAVEEELGKVRKARKAEQKGDGSFAKVDDLAGGATKVPEDVAEQFKSIRGYWTDSTEFENMKVWRRDDLIDPTRVDQKGVSSLDRMRGGKPPIGPDGLPLNVHHLNQAAAGPVAEMTETFHKANHKTIHINDNSIPSGIDRPDFGAWSTDYWKHRAEDFE